MNQEDLTLRDITYLMRTLRSMMQRIFLSTFNLSKGKAEIPSPKEIGELMLASMRLALEEQSIEDVKGPFERNMSKLIAKLLFSLCMMIPFDETAENVSKVISQVIVEAVYGVFKAQVLMSQNFRDHFGKCNRNQIVDGFVIQ